MSASLHKILTVIMLSKILTFSQIWPKLVRKLKLLGKYHQTQNVSMKVMLSYQNKAKINVLDHLPAHVNLHKQYQLKFILQFSKASKTKLEGTAEYSANSRISFHVKAGKSAERVNLTSFSHYNICTQYRLPRKWTTGSMCIFVWEDSL